MERGVTARRASSITGISTASLYRPKPPDRNAELRERLRAVWRPNMGYRMAHAIVSREMCPLNEKRVHRIWKQERLGRMKRYRKKRTGSSVPISAEAPNNVWCVDFCYDACLNGTKLKVLAIKDEFTRECLALEAATSIKSLRLQRVLEGLFEARGAPGFLRSDNGPEFISRSLAVFLSLSGTESKFIKPGSPWQNGYAESFIFDPSEGVSRCRGLSQPGRRSNQACDLPQVLQRATATLFNLQPHTRGSHVKIPGSVS